MALLTDTSTGEVEGAIFIAPDGTIDVVRDISVDSDQLDFLRAIGSGQTSGQTVQLAKLVAVNLTASQKIQLASTAISVTTCAASLFSIFVPVTIPVAIVACGSAVLSVGTSLAAINNPELESSLTGISLLGSIVGCGSSLSRRDPLGCADLLTGIIKTGVNLVKLVRQQGAPKIEEATEQLTPLSSIAACPSGTLTEDIVITTNESPCVISGTVTVPAGITLTVHPDVVVKFNDNTQIYINGTLNALGTTTQPIYFTSIHDDIVGGDTNNNGSATTPAPGDWQRLYVGQTGTVNLTYAVVRYSGIGSSGNPAAIVSYGQTNLDNTQISTNLFGGLQVNDGTTIVTNSEIDNSSIGILHTFGTLTIDRSSIHDNTNAGLQNTATNTSTAINNWWGDPTGPFHINLNDSGQGNQVSDNVDFIPFLISDPVSTIP